jgi:hypothetical protein
MWSMESWTDHLREVGRLSDTDRAVLARACAFQSDPATRPPARYLAVDPALAAADAHRHADHREQIVAVRPAVEPGPA